MNKFLTMGILLLLANQHLHGQPQTSGLRLSGIINLPTIKCALLEKSEPTSGLDAFYILHEGQREGEVEILEIHPEAASVKARIKNQAGEASLMLTNPAARQGLGISFENATLDSVLKLYGDWAGRTLLRYPALPKVSMTLAAAATGTNEAARVIETALAEKGISTIRDGKSFAMVVPQRLTLTVAPHAPEVKPSAKTDPTEVLPPGAINFPNTESVQVMQIYAELAHRNLDRSFSLPVPPSFVVKFQNQTPLSREEVLYALDTLFAWSGIKMVSAGVNQIKAVPIEQSR